MEFSEIDIENFRCFDDTSVRFENGVVAVHGSNGAGKSSLLEAVFFSLYGSNALSSGTTLEDVLTTGEDGASVTLSFRHDGTRYKLTREIRRRGDRASNTKSVLRADGPVVADGARDVTGYITDLLHMDADAFVNCAYIRQGGVTKLINASPSERQAMIDELLQLGTLEEYRERASQARVGTGRVRDTQAGTVEELESQIEEKEEENLVARQEHVTTELERVNDTIDDLEQRREDAGERRDEAQSALEQHEERRERIADLEDEIDDLDEAIATARNEREELRLKLYQNGTEAGTARSKVRTAITEPEETISTDEVVSDTGADLGDEATETAGIVHDQEQLQQRIDKAEREEDDAAEASTEANEKRRKAGEAATSHEGDAVNAAESAASKRDRVDELNDKILKDADTIRDLEDEYEEKQETISEVEEDLSDQEYDTDDVDGIKKRAVERRERLDGRIKTVQQDLGAAQAHINRATKLQEEGRCPECGQSVDESPHVTHLDEEQQAIDHLKAKNERLQDERDEAEQVAESADTLMSHREELEELNDEVEEARDERDGKQDRVDDLETEVERLNTQSMDEYQQARSKRAEAAEAAERAEECEEERKQARQQASRLRTLKTDLSSLATAITTLQDTLRQRNEITRENEARRGEIHEAARERRELLVDTDEREIERMEETVASEQERIEQFNTWEDELEAMRNKRQQTLGLIDGALSDLEQLRERRDDAAERAERLEDFYQEMEELEAMYDNVRSDLRQRNIEHLQRILNDVFDVLYRNDAYAGIELDENYAFTVHEKGGSTLDPTQLSGGEQVLFNLSLRCAIYKLLAQGVRGGESMPPLILDEPTAHLDTGHVSRLTNIVDIMRELGVSQTVIVSHDDEIVDSADGEIQLVQDSTTNRSSVATPNLGVPPAQGT